MCSSFQPLLPLSFQEIAHANDLLNSLCHPLCERYLDERTLKVLSKNGVSIKFLLDSFPLTHSNTESSIFYINS